MSIAQKLIPKSYVVLNVVKLFVLKVIRHQQATRAVKIKGVIFRVFFKENFQHFRENDRTNYIYYTTIIIL